MTGPGEGSPAPVSVVISTLGRPQQLARCVDALLAGTQLPSEIVVVDQGDAAATTAVLAERVDRGVALVHVPHAGRGLSASQNAGVDRARCPTVCVVDDDCVPDARWVEVAAAEHGAAAGPLLVAGRVLPLAPHGERTMPLASRTRADRAVLGRDSLPWEVGTGGNFSVTRAAYQRVGGNDERLGTGTAGRAGNDLDLFHRLQRAGVQPVYQPDMLVHHERATPEEHRGRRWTYGFGVGVCVAAWLRERDPSALPVLAAWVVLRLRRMRRARTPGAVRDEFRVLRGTVGGLWHGCRMGPRRPAAGPT